MITIDKNIPIPIQKNSKLYPYDKMKVGDSFEVEGRKKNTVLSGAQAWAKIRKLKWKFTIRSMPDNKIRIWRIK